MSTKRVEDGDRNFMGEEDVQRGAKAEHKTHKRERINYEQKYLCHISLEIKWEQV